MQEKEPFFTIITPTYNRSVKLHRVYDSLKKQTFRCFEWIVVDDGSSDGTDELMSEYKQASDFAIHYYYQSNAGKTSALAYAMPLAKGELIIIADSDDEFSEYALSSFYNAWQSLDAPTKQRCNGVIALCVSQHNEPIGAQYESEGLYDPIKFAFGGEIERVGENWIASNAKMMKKHFALSKQELALGFIPESYFWNKIVMQEKPVGYRINQYLRTYYVHEAEASLSVGIRKKAAKGFHFESMFFLNHYQRLLYRYPKPYLKHLIKYILFVQHLNMGFGRGLSELVHTPTKILYTCLFPAGFLLKKQYFHEGAWM